MRPTDQSTVAAVAPTPPPVPTIGFLMEQVAGHVTHYATLRAVVDRDPSLRALWHEITYHVPGGRLERLQARLPWLPSYPLGVARAALQLRRALIDPRHQAILLNSRVATFFPGLVRRRPAVLDTDVTPVQLDRLPGYAGPADPPPLAWAKHRLFQRFVQGLAGVVAWSRWAADSFVADYGVPAERVTVCPPGVDLGFWQPAPPRPADADRPARILFVGGDFRRKGGLDLLAWFAAQAPANAELHLVTREPVPPQPGVHVHHNLSPNTPPLRQLYHEADLFVLPSHGECFGIATVEAMACGLPVVVTDVGGAADIVVPGATGWLIPPGDPRALGAALAAALGDPAARRRLGRAGRQRVEERFDARLTAQGRVDLLKRCVMRNP